MYEYGKITDKAIQNAYEAAKETYAAYGVDVEEAMERLGRLEISIHCWQGDDVMGFDGGGTGGGIMAVGSYPYRARTAEELRGDMEKALSLIPGKRKMNLHASYAQLNGEKIDRDKYETRHFKDWINWAKKLGIGLDFNPTCFAHPMASGDFTLASPDENVRRFWIDHVKACRRIASDMGKALGKICVNNIWIPDGMKDFPADRLYYREILKNSLDEILAEPLEMMTDAVESKLFGLGSESYVVGSHDFYMGYLPHAKRDIGAKLMITLDMGHFHVAESVADKISSILTFSDNLLMHFSRGVRWDSDHVAVNSDELNEVMREVEHAGAFDKVLMSTDYFDASINRVAAWVIGGRAVMKSALGAMLEPTGLIKQAERRGDYTARLALVDEARSLPVSAVWDYFCQKEGIPAKTAWLEEIRRYEKDVMSARG